MTRRALAAVLVVLSGCTKENPAFGKTESSDTADEPVTTSTTSTSPSTSPSTTTTTTTLDPTTSGATQAGTSGPDPTTTSTSPPDTTGDATTGSSTDEELLIEYDPRGCDLPFWCIDGQPFNPLPARVWSQVCFQPQTKPPFAVVRVRYRIAGVLGDPSANAFLQVHTRVDDQPGMEVDSLPLTVDQLTVGEHEVTLPVPKPIHDVDGVCVGLVGGDATTSDLGVAIDPSSKPSNQSYFHIDGGPGCNYPPWTDIMDLQIPQEWSGAWCIEADIVKLPDP